jgi:hypothetical protein
LKKILFTEQENIAAKELYLSGKSLCAVSRILGRSIFGVQHRLKKMGVPIRSVLESQKFRKKYVRLAPGIKHTEDSRRKMSQAAKSRGATHNWFVDGQGKERDIKRKREMDRLEYRLWRESVFMRDGFMCQSCHEKGGNLHADHIKPWRSFPELRYELSNGRTLCVGCHKNTPTYGNSAARIGLLSF